MSGDVLLGLEVRKLGDPDDGSPWQMIVDVWDARDQKILRYQIVGDYNGWPEGPPERTLDDLARYQFGAREEREAKATELDRLDREAAAKAAPIFEELFRAQVAVLYGAEGLELIDREQNRSG